MCLKFGLLKGVTEIWFGLWNCDLGFFPNFIVSEFHLIFTTMKFAMTKFFGNVMSTTGWTNDRPRVKIFAKSKTCWTNKFHFLKFDLEFREMKFFGLSTFDFVMSNMSWTHGRPDMKIFGKSKSER